MINAPTPADREQFLQTLSNHLTACSEYDIIAHVDDPVHHEVLRKHGPSLGICDCSISTFYRTFLATPSEDLVEIVLLYLLLITPNVTTFWNCRRRLVQAGQLDPKRELWLSRLILRTHPRSNETIFHRQWIMHTYYSESVHILSMEFDLCDEIGDAYRLHYGLWDYRRFLLDKLRSNVFEKELIRLDKWLSSHPTDSSGWTYLTDLLQRIVHSGDSEQYSVPRCKELIVDRLNHVSSLLQSYPERECLWLFMRTATSLLRQLDRDSSMDFVMRHSGLSLTDIQTLVEQTGGGRTRFRSIDDFVDWAFEHDLTGCTRANLNWTELLRLRHLFWLARDLEPLQIVLSTNSSLQPPS